MNDPKFQREFNTRKVKSLTKEGTLFTEKLQNDIAGGVVFPAIRNEVMHFYFKGGKVFEFDTKYRTNIKYGFVPESNKTVMEESDLQNISPVKSFVDGYEKIKDRCGAYCHVEAFGVSALYKDSAWCNKKELGDIVLLDIEAMFFSNSQQIDVVEPKNAEDKITSKYDRNRFDIVLYNSASQEIRVFEAKHFSNSELWSKQGNIPEVTRQIQRYKEVIQNRETEIVNAYTKQIKIMNELFGKEYPEPITVCKEVGLLVFGFDMKQIAKIKSQYENAKTPIYMIGDEQGICAKKLYESINMYL